MTKYFAARWVRKMVFQSAAIAATVAMSPSFLANYGRAAAQDDSKQVTKDKVVVLAHMPVPGSAVRQILVQQEKGKQYLLLQQNVHFTVVDVTDPKNPQIVDRVAEKGKLAEVGAGLAISVQSDQSAQGSVPTQTVRLVDLGNPKNPRVVKTLNGVTSIYSDDGRQLIYLTNSEGLWIIKHYETFRLPYCTTESAENTVAQCQ
jgi:hypothetical protein